MAEEILGIRPVCRLRASWLLDNEQLLVNILKTYPRYLTIKIDTKIELNEKSENTAISDNEWEKSERAKQLLVLSKCLPTFITGKKKQGAECAAGPSCDLNGCISGGAGNSRKTARGGQGMVYSEGNLGF